jgi:hypothetical protein
MTQFAGIDVGQNHTFSCVLDMDLRRFHYPQQALSLHETLAWIRGFKTLKGACIDGPPNPNNGALAQRLPHGTNLNTNRRLTEFQIGIGGCYSTRAVLPEIGASNYWMQSAFDLFQHLENELYWSIDKGGGIGQLIETHPTYAFKGLLGCIRNEVDGIQRLRLDPQARLRRKHSVEGRLQRIELLTAICGEIEIEITEELLQKWNQRIDWVDAAICAFMSHWQQTMNPELVAPGDLVEGAIFIRIPKIPFGITANDFRERKIVQGSGSATAPVLLLHGNPISANAIILRLGDTIDLNRGDTIDAMVSYNDFAELWFPCQSNAMTNLARNLNLIGGRFYLAWGQTLRVALIIGNVINDNNLIPYPGELENPWPMTQCRFWLRVNEAVEINNGQFFVNQHGEWAEGFGNGQTALLWAFVPTSDA